MRRFSRVFWIASTLAACTVQEDDLRAPSDQGGDATVTELEDAVQVCRVRDGDTVEVQLDANADCTEGTGDITAVRFKGIDAPEVAKTGVPAEPFGDESRAHTQANVGLLVRLEFNSDCGADWYTCRDDFERLLAYVRTAAGTDLGLQLVQQGLARISRRNNGSVFPFDRQTEYLAAEAAAQQGDLGVWSE